MAGSWNAACFGGRTGLAPLAMISRRSAPRLQDCGGNDPQVEIVTPLGPMGDGAIVEMKRLLRIRVRAQDASIRTISSLLLPAPESQPCRAAEPAKGAILFARACDYRLVLRSDSGDYQSLGQ